MILSLYKNIEKTIRNHEDKLRVDYNVQASDVRHAIRWVMRDNPDICWFVHLYQFDQENKLLSLWYQFSKERSELIQKSINDVIEKDFQIEHVRTLSVFEQVMYVYKWLLTYCNYNVNSAYNQNIDSVFVRRNSVCTGYAKAAQYMFKLLGINSMLVFGRLNNDIEDGRHCWNIVNIEGKYYHIDICLGDSELEDLLVMSGVMNVLKYGDFNYNLFCVSTEIIAKTRTIEDIESLPCCDSSLEKDRIEALSRISLKKRNSVIGCLVSNIGSSADIYLCSKDKNVVLKRFRGGSISKCAEEYTYMEKLRGCKHLIQLNNSHSDWKHNIIAVEQSTPIVDLFCSHYYHPTLNGVLKMIEDITMGWLECYQSGIIYRDIHVCNIYKANDGKYKLGDFGSCTYEHRSSNEKVGNPWFMSPETYIRGIFDERSAVYSITAVLYFILNRMLPPFVDGQNKMTALERKMKGEAFPKPVILRSLPKDVADIIMKKLIARGCAFYPTNRIQSCKELLNILNGIRTIFKDKRIELRFVQQNLETFLDNKIVSNVYIPRDIHHRFASRDEYGVTFGQYSEEKEKLAMKVESAVFNNEDDDCMDFSPCPIQDEVEVFCLTMGCAGKSMPNTFSPVNHNKRSFWKNMFVKKSYKAYSSIFAPAEVKRGNFMMVQVYLHLYEETEFVKLLAIESDKDTERRDYIPLQFKLKKGDKVDILLNIYGDTLLMSEKRCVVWQGSFTKCRFGYNVPEKIDVDNLNCVTMLSVNGIPVGEMQFITKIVDSPRDLNTEIISHKYRKVFISYSHKDESKVKSFHKGLELASVPHFFDRKYLKAGDVFPQVIQNYINNADLFVLFWSENASKSEYVEKERKLALKLAFPQVKPPQNAKLTICPINVEPYAEIPDDMKYVYHFGEL